jgi:hypothetical protein
LVGNFGNLLLGISWFVKGVMLFSNPKCDLPFQSYYHFHNELEVLALLGVLQFAHQSAILSEHNMLQEASRRSLRRCLKAGPRSVDNVLAREFSEAPGIETHGSIGVLLWATAKGYVQDRNDTH